jgi:hypothetical protein
MISWVISHTACFELEMSKTDFLQATYCFEVHRGELKQPPEERR